MIHKLQRAGDLSCNQPQTYKSLSPCPSKVTQYNKPLSTVPSAVVSLMAVPWEHTRCKCGNEGCGKYMKMATCNVTRDQGTYRLSSRYKSQPKQQYRIHCPIWVPTLYLQFTKSCVTLLKWQPRCVTSCKEICKLMLFR